jgi:hypothetical protein
MAKAKKEREELENYEEENLHLRNRLQTEVSEIVIEELVAQNLGLIKVIPLSTT